MDATNAGRILEMAYLTYVKDDRGRKLAELIGTHDRYRFDDGSTMFVQCQPAWCERCAEFAMTEKLVSPDELESRAREFAARRSKNRLLPLTIASPAEQDAMNSELLKKLLGEARHWGAALRNRTSPPRCLECAGTIFVVIPREEPGIAHPADPHRMIYAECVAHASMASSGRLYDTEGRQIQNLSDQS
jgi:hypothetical protein